MKKNVLNQEDEIEDQRYTNLHKAYNVQKQSNTSSHRISDEVYANLPSEVKEAIKAKASRYQSKIKMLQDELSKYKRKSNNFNTGEVEHEGLIVEDNAEVSKSDESQYDIVKQFFTKAKAPNPTTNTTSTPITRSKMNLTITSRPMFLAKNEQIDETLQVENEIPSHDYKVDTGEFQDDCYGTTNDIFSKVTCNDIKDKFPIIEEKEDIADKVTKAVDDATFKKHIKKVLHQF